MEKLHFRGRGAITYTQTSTVILAHWGIRFARAVNYPAQQFHIQALILPGLKKYAGLGLENMLKIREF